VIFGELPFLKYSDSTSHNPSFLSWYLKIYSLGDVLEGVLSATNLPLNARTDHGLPSTRI
jgi:hypothetical protein